MNWEQRIKQEVGNNKYPTLKRIKIGKALFVFASLPLFSAWAYALAIPMMIPIKPTLWAKDKIRYLKDWVLLK